MEHQLRLCALLLCIWNVFAQTSTTAVISPPQGFNASLGSASTVFQCDVTGADNIEWSVDGTPSNRDIVTARGIVTSDVITINSTTDALRSTLTVPTTEVNDNTAIFCIAERPSPQVDINSATVFHLVQGLLEPPPQLEISNTQDSFIRTLSWETPETIDLTDIEPDITNYRVCFNISEEELTCVNVSESTQQYMFVNLRVPLLFSVSAVNVVGEGNSSTIEHEACDPTTGLAAVSGSEVNTQVEFQTGGDPSVIISLPQSVSAGEDEDCFNLYSVLLTPLSAADSSTLHGPLIPDVTEASGSENQRTISFNVDNGINSNELYSVIIITVNVNGEKNSTGDIVFSTYDVQDVSITATAGGLILSCTFATGSEAVGCSLRVCQRVGNGGTAINQDSCQDVSILRQSGPPTATLSDLEPGVYTVMAVREMEGDGSETDLILEALQLTDAEVTEEEQTTPLVTTIPSVQTPEPVFPSSPSNTTAIIIGCVVGGIVVIFLVLGILVVLCLIVNKMRRNKLAKQNESYGHKQLWQEESDGRTPIVETPNQINGTTTPPDSNALNPLYENPLTTIAVIQGGTGGHHNIIRTATDPQQTELTSSLNGQESNESVQHTQGPYTGEPYAIVDKTKKSDSADTSKTDKNERSATSPLYTDIMRNSEKVDLADRDSIEKIPLSNSDRSLNSDAEKPKLSFEDLKASSESLLSTGSQSSMTGAYPTYAELEHHRSMKKEKQPSDKTGVLYSEIKVDEIPPVLPQKKVRSNSSLRREIGTSDTGPSHLV